MGQVKICVVGAGVAGLASAVNIQRSMQHAQVTIISDKFLSDTTSDGAAGLFLPRSEGTDVSSDLFRQWCKDSADHYRKIAGSKDAGKCGIYPISGYYLRDKEMDAECSEFVYNFRRAPQDELDKLNSDYRYGYAFTSWIIEPGKYMPALMREFKENGGKTEQRVLQTLEELVGHYDIVVNCSGLASRWLVNDPKVYTKRGQLVKVKAPWVNLVIFTDDDTYIIPRSEDVVLGGVRQREDYSTEIRKTETRQIIDRCAKFIPSVKEAEILKEWTGLRPHREPLRLEIENMMFKSGTLPVVHNYGHGAQGISLCWGTGVHTTKLVNDCLDKLQLKSQL